MTTIFHGVIPALMTEMKEGGAIDHEATSRHIESCLSAGVNGFVMLGTLGENSSLSLDEKEAVVRNAVATALRTTASFSSSESEEFSPSVPSMTKPFTPALRQLSMWRDVAS